MREFQPELNGAQLRIAIVRGRFNEEIGAGLLSACLQRLLALGVSAERITVASVPGALEIPLALQKLAATENYDALIALGAVVRGGTYHFEVVSNESAAGVSQVQLDSGLPIANGILTTDTEEQALARVQQKGADCAYVAGLDVPVFTSRPDRMPLAELGARLPGHVTVLIGHSGVGKSTIVNALVPDAGRAIGAVNDVTGRGRHTSSSTVSLRYRSADGSGWLIDTPGVRSFGLGHVDPRRVLAAFADLAQAARDCPRGCTHLPDAPDCALPDAAAEGRLGPAGTARLDSLHRLLGALTPA